MALKAFAGQQHDAHIAAHLIMGLSPMIQANPMAATELQKHVLQHIKLKAEEDAEAELFQQYGTDPDNMISDLEREALIALKVTQYFQEAKAMQTELSGAPEADPIVQLKEQELQQRAAKDQADAQIKQQQIANEQMRIQQNAESDEARIQSQEKIADQRADVARERIYAPKG